MRKKLTTILASGILLCLSACGVQSVLPVIKENPIYDKLREDAKAKGAVVLIANGFLTEKYGCRRCKTLKRRRKGFGR
ncbi:MAG: hypothetical protein NC433_17995 [Clostridiales bacterium]|nr:hypothetical protein [Clostridiales bacterium]